MALPTDEVPVIKQGWLRAAVFCVAFLGAVYLTGVIAGMAVVLAAAGNSVAVSTDTITILSLFISALVSIILVLVFRRWVDKKPLRSMGIVLTGHAPDAWIGFLLGPALLGSGSLILYFTNNLHWTDITFQPADLFIALIMTVFVSAGEELVFRGYLLGNLCESFNKRIALGLSALLFTLVHINNPGLTGIAIINLILGGLLLGINYIYTGNLWFAFTFHCSWNFFQGPVLGYEVSGVKIQSLLQQEQTGSTLLTGGQFGFEGSLIASLLLLATLLLFWFVYEKRYAASTPSAA